MILEQFIDVEIKHPQMCMSMFEEEGIVHEKSETSLTNVKVEQKSKKGNTETSTSAY